jgi:hypothetical protein
MKKRMSGKRGILGPNFNQKLIKESDSFGKLFIKKKFRDQIPFWIWASRKNLDIKFLSDFNSY